MKKLAIIFLFLLVTVLSATDVSGEQSGTWEIAGSPYNIIGEVTIPANTTLTIEPGVEVIGQNQFKIIAEGNILAEGTVTDSIHFHANEGELWGGIKLEDEENESLFSYCIIENTDDMNDNGINSLNSPMTIQNSRFSYHDEAISIFSLGNNNPPQILISNCLITDCVGSGISLLENRNTVIENCELTRNGSGTQFKGAIQISSQTTNMEVTPTIQNCFIHNNYKQGITIVDMFNVGGFNPLIENCVITENLTGVYFYNTFGTINETEITNNFIEGDANSGAGIMTYGAAANCVITNSLIAGNFTGLYAINSGSANFGNLNNDDETDDGLNTIVNNVGPDGTPNSLYCNTDGVIWAENCFWGTEDTNEIDTSITDSNDGSGSATADYLPLAVPYQPAVITGTVSYAGTADYESIFVGVANHQNMEYYFTSINAAGEYSIEIPSSGEFYVGATAQNSEEEDFLFGSYPELNSEETITVTEGETLENIDIELLEIYPNYKLFISDNYQQNENDIYELSYQQWLYPIEEKYNLYYDENGDVKIYSILGLNDESENPMDWSYEEYFPEQEVWYYKGGYGDWTTAKYNYNGGLYYVTSVHDFRPAFFDFAEDTYGVSIIDYQIDENSIESWWFTELGVAQLKIMEDGGTYSILSLSEATVENDSENFFPLATDNYWEYSITPFPMYPSDLSYEINQVTEDRNEQVVELYWDPPYVNSEEGIEWEGYYIYESGVQIAEVEFGTNTYDIIYPNEREFVDLYVTAYNGEEESESSNTVTVEIVDNENDANGAKTISLSNYPNPFNPTTTISFNLDQEANVNLDIFNIRGQKITNLVDEKLTAKTHSIHWNGTDKSGKKVASGIYYYRLQTDNDNLIRKMLLLK